MSESSLWDRIRNNIGHTAHFSRIEFTPEAGIPDVTFCSHGVEGFIELKHCHEAPKRANTRVFGSEGLRDSQIIWIYRRVKHGGRVWILPQIDESLYLVEGRHCRVFNEMTLHQIEKASTWSSGGRMSAQLWVDLADALTTPKVVIPTVKARRSHTALGRFAP